MLNTRTKKEKTCTHGVVGGDRVCFSGDIETPTGDMLPFKILFNSVVLTPQAIFMAFDNSNFYLDTPMPRYAQVKMRLVDIPDKVVNEDKLHKNKKVTPNSFSYVKV